MTKRRPQIAKRGSAAEIIQRASEEGRAIVPFLGAGLSAASGFPLINELRDYLCKVRFLIERGVYRHFLGGNINQRQGADSPEFSPARYIDSYGWPDVNQLDADLWWFFIDESRSPQAMSDGTRLERFDDKVLAEKFSEFKVKCGEQTRWGKGRWCLQSAIHHVILEDLQIHDSPLASTISNELWNLKLKPRIDWFRYLLDLAGGRRGLVDALFTQLNNLREPSLGHTMLAQLAQEFGWRLHLTINFDTLLETAFRREQLTPTVFEVSRDTEPPDPSLVNRSKLALIKLHGGSFDLRIGESLDHALDEPTREHLFGCVPDDALLLVIGFSGYERRMMQLIEELVIRRQLRNSKDVRILWMHGEATPPPTVIGLQQKLGHLGRQTEFKPARLSDAGHFLLETFQVLSSTLPYSTQPYAALPKRIVFSERTDEIIQTSASAKTDDSKPRQAETFFLFARQSLESHAHTDSGLLRPELTRDIAVPSLRMSEFIQTMSGYHLVWIDLEDHHTVSGIVSEVIHKMRAFDPHLPHLVLPVDDRLVMSGGGIDPQHRFEKSARYIRRALRRGRYILAFDSLEGFGREQTAHHGLPADLIPRDTTDTGDRPTGAFGLKEKRLWERLDELLSFFKKFLEGDDPLTDSFSDFYICVSVDEPSHRHLVSLPPTPSVGPHTPQVRSQIRALLVDFCKLFDKTTNANCHPTFIPPELAPRAPLKTKSVLLAKFLEYIQEMDSNKTQATEYLTSLERDGWSAADDDFNTSLSPLLDVAPFPDEKHVLGLLLVLATFRRPRSFAAIYTVVADLFIPRNQDRDAFDPWLTESLDSLKADGVLNPMDGGFLWIHHYLHEWVYKMLSEPIRSQCARTSTLQWVNNDWPVDGNTGVETTGELQGEKRITRLMDLILIHSRIASFYYLDAYGRSHDIAALYEYLYHRLSSIKYVVTLQRLCVHADEILLCHPESHERLIKRAAEWCLRDGLIRKNEERMPATLAEAADRGKRNYLQRLLNVLRREERAIISRGTADTWLSWIDILHTEVARLQDDHLAVPGSDADATAREILWMLNTLGVQLLREKGARGRCAEHLLQLLAVAGDSCAKALECARNRGEIQGDLSDRFDAILNKWREIVPAHRSHLSKEGAIGEMREQMDRMVSVVSIVFDEQFLAGMLCLPNVDVESVTREVTRFFWCFRQSCACLRHFVKPGEVQKWLNAASNWMRQLDNVIGLNGG